MNKYLSPLKADDVRQICLINDFDINDRQWRLLEKWSDLLLETNKKVNLISRKDTVFLWEKQILSCLTLLILRKFLNGSEICDFGTGGGLPGLLLSIVRPDLNLTLFESRKKKVKFVNEMIEALKIPNVQIIHGRGEELGKKKSWFKRFSHITSRGVAPISDLVFWTKNLRAEKSAIHIFKGGEIEKELAYISKEYKEIKINSTLMNLNGYQKFADNKKYLISLEFYSE